MADVQRWLDDPSSNFGWLLLGNESTNRTAKRFDGRQNVSGFPDPQPPVLTVKYLGGPPLVAATAPMASNVALVSDPDQDDAVPGY